ncbi:DUF397 domain-containing protein [Streptomyces sp. NPDC058155]|uniref:DUF397 domain-containing protein n=1 Tax=Streptomyces sp. NPDC058155 TaxID=3346359 RepID=UPI0036ED5613
MPHTSGLCWVKSSFSGDGGNNCVEVAVAEQDGIALRDSTRPSQTFTTSRGAFLALVGGVKAGVFTPRA